MPTVAVDAEYLIKGLDNKFPDEKCMEKLMFDFGAELDSVEMDEDGRTIYKVEVAANRYDLLCNEGILSALKTFVRQHKTNKLLVKPYVYTIMVDSTVASVRPIVVAAVMRDITFTDLSYKSFIDLQDKLHHNIGRMRSLVSIGTHDLDKMNSTEIIYTAKLPRDISFVPLNQTSKYTGEGIMELYETHAQLRQYLPLIRNSPRYPIISEAGGEVLSLPPIINSDYSKMSKDTKNVFIEITAIDQTKAHIALHMLLAAFTQYCKETYSVEAVRIIYESNELFRDLSGSTQTTPLADGRIFKSSVEYIKNLTGIADLDNEIIGDTLTRMGLQPGKVDANGKFECCVPPTRSDILHECDIAEDVAIAYGYNNLMVPVYPCTSEQPIQGLMHQLRRTIPQYGYNEVLNWALGSISDSYDKFQCPFDPDRPNLQGNDDKIAYCPYISPVRTNKAKAREFEVLRPSLLGGVLKTLNSNKHAKLPVRMFELGGTSGLTADGMRSMNRNYLCCLIASNDTAGFEEVHGLLDAVLMKLQCKPVYADVMDNEKPTADDMIYLLEDSSDPAFMENRNVKIVLNVPDRSDMVIGRMGILKPDVMRAFGLTLAASAFEISLQPFLYLLPHCDLFDE